MNTTLYAHIVRTETSTTVTASTFSTSSTAQVVPITGSSVTVLLAAHYHAPVEYPGELRLQLGGELCVLAPVE